jgi:hypothetical protein
MARRRKKNSGTKWVLVLVAVAALAWFGRAYWMPYVPHKATAPVQSLVEQPAPAPSVEPAAVATVAGAQPAQTATTATFLSEAEARDLAARQAREQTLKVQKQLRESQQAVKAAADAAETDKNTRCIGGQKMKRVDNGWVQAGTC